MQENINRIGEKLLVPSEMLFGKPSAYCDKETGCEIIFAAESLFIGGEKYIECRISGECGTFNVPASIIESFIKIEKMI